MLLIAAAALVWTAFNGASHYMHSDHDWLVRDAVLGDLIYQNWPVAYRGPDGSTLLLRSAIGYFLPPALFARVFGIDFIDLVIHLWTAAGVALFLTLLPLSPRVGRTLLLGLLVTVFFSGMDFLGVLIATQTTPIFPLRLEWWGPFSYPSLTGQLVWAPNHSLALWIGTALLFRHRDDPDYLRIALLLLPVTLIWTPFAALGLLPFAVLGGIRNFRESGAKALPPGLVIAAGVFSLPLLSILLLDLGQVEAGHVLQSSGSMIHREAHLPVSGIAYLTFVSCEFLLFALALAPHLRRDHALFWIAVGILLLLPTMRWGPSNDALLRLSTPSLLILLCLFLQDGLSRGSPWKKPSLLMAWLCIAIGACTGFTEFWRTATFPRQKPDYRVSLPDLQGGSPAPHYAARLGSSLPRVLLRPTTPGRPGTQPSQ